MLNSDFNINVILQLVYKKYIYMLLSPNLTFFIIRTIDTPQTPPTPATQLHSQVDWTQHFVF